MGLVILLENKFKFKYWYFCISFDRYRRKIIIKIKERKDSLWGFIGKI